MSGPRPVSAIGPWERVLRVPPHGGVLVFDGYCGFCTRAVHTVRRLDRRKRVRALPLQGQGVLELTGLTRDHAMAQAWWIPWRGDRVGGAGAMAAAVAAGTGLPLLGLYRVPGLRQLTDRSYRWIAAHRRLLRGVTPHCAAHPDACSADVGTTADGIHPY